jgi:hypothetical protein
MNPLQWMKAVYETFGTPYPRSSLVAVSILGAILFAAAWLLAAKQVENDRRASTSAAPPQVSGSASSMGDNSPANTGNGNSTQYDQSSHSGKKQQSPKKD